MRSAVKRQWVSLLAVLGAAVLTPALADGADTGEFLDGRVFVGKIGVKGNPDTADKLHFRDGQFWSERCIQCGFNPGPYEAHKVGATIYVRGRLSGSGGTFDYSGTIVGDTAQMDIKWTKSRWYWTIERDWAFAGTLQPADQAPAVEAAARTAASVSPAQRAHCEL